MLGSGWAVTGQGCRGFFWGDRNVLKAIMVHSSPATLRTSQQYMATLPQTPRQPNSQAGNKTQSEFGTKSESPLLPTCWRARPLSQGENGLTGLSLIVGTEAEPELGAHASAVSAGVGGQKHRTTAHRHAATCSSQEGRYRYRVTFPKLRMFQRTGT